MLPCVQDGVDDAEVSILNRHRPASKGHHATAVGQVEIMQHRRGGSLQGTEREYMIRIQGHILLGCPISWNRTKLHTTCKLKVQNLRLGACY